MMIFGVKIKCMRNLSHQQPYKEVLWNVLKVILFEVFVFFIVYLAWFIFVFVTL